MLNDYLKRLLSEYADDALDLETTRRVSDFIEENAEAEHYFHKLQALRQATAACLGEEEDDPALELRMMNELRLRSYELPWWERLWERRVLSPRTAVAVAVVLFLLVITLFAWLEAPVSRLLSGTKARVETMREEVQQDLSERGGELTGNLLELFTPQREEDGGTNDQVGGILPKGMNAV